MNIVAIDPGKACGFARFFTRKVWSETFASDEYERWPCLERVYQLVEARFADLVVCESFVPRPGVRTWQPDALEIIGALRYVCYRSGVPFETQSPGDAKGFATNRKLDQIGWRNRTTGGHADDAARHLLLAAVRHNVIDPAQFI